MRITRKRVRLEFTAITTDGVRHWNLDKRLLALRLTIESRIGPDGVAVFDTWLRATTESPDLSVGERKVSRERTNKRKSPGR